MGNSIELRLPYLDYRVMDFAAKIPASWKIKVLNEKYILKEAFREIIPERIRKRAKQPYRAPIREALLSGGPDCYVREMLSAEYLRKTGYFNEKKVGHLLAKFKKNNSSLANETSLSRFLKMTFNSFEYPTVHMIFPLLFQTLFQ